MLSLLQQLDPSFIPGGSRAIRVLDLANQKSKEKQRQILGVLHKQGIKTSECPVLYRMSRSKYYREHVACFELIRLSHEAGLRPPNLRAILFGTAPGAGTFPLGGAYDGFVEIEAKWSYKKTPAATTLQLAAPDLEAARQAPAARIRPPARSVTALEPMPFLEPSTVIAPPTRKFARTPSQQYDDLVALAKQDGGKASTAERGASAYMGRRSTAASRGMALGDLRRQAQADGGSGKKAQYNRGRRYGGTAAAGWDKERLLQATQEDGSAPAAEDHSRDAAAPVRAEAASGAGSFHT